ncbi:hypothetical protein DCAR_0415943 [Daucus carota subsp. sativus]|uniref:Uncharacterized protein n=1 Tax=Daucus carota subsp. sativus TaxID=79200 RepID=A0AAF0WV06_DAUCS|nr:hypothetical protein DCAR_0415943 [Daucus carota subsp. sativus]
MGTMEPVNYFDESFLRTEEDYVNTYSKSYRIPLWKTQLFLKNSPGYI